MDLNVFVPGSTRLLRLCRLFFFQEVLKLNNIVPVGLKAVSFFFLLLFLFVSASSLKCALTKYFIIEVSLCW